jgi:hypothetical protein
VEGCQILHPYKQREKITMQDDDTPLSKFLLVDSLCIDDGLAVKRPHRRRLIESYDAIICAHLLERTKHGRLVATCQDRCAPFFQTDETKTYWSFLMIFRRHLPNYGARGMNSTLPKYRPGPVQAANHGRTNGTRNYA